MELHSEKTLRFARTALKNHISALAVEKGIKESAARATIAKSIGVDPSSVRQFCKREIRKPALKTMQKYVDWLAANPEKVEKPSPDSNEGLRAKIKELEERNANLIKAHGRMRGEIVEANQKLHECQAADPEFADKYKVVDPENAYWMENAEALIEISTGYMLEAEPVRKRVCTIPIPLLMNHWRWDSDKETREENDARREKALSESFGKVYQLARSITELYSSVGGWPDDEIIVDIKFQNIEGM